MAINPPQGGFSILEAFGEVGDALEKGDKRRLDAQRQEIQNRLDEARIQQTNVAVSTQRQQLAEMVQSAPLRHRVAAAEGARVIGEADKAASAADRTKATMASLVELRDSLEPGDERRVQIENLLKEEVGFHAAQRSKAQADLAADQAVMSGHNLADFEDFREQLRRIKGAEMDVAEATGDLKRFVVRAANDFFKTDLENRNATDKAEFLRAVANYVTGSTVAVADDLKTRAAQVEVDVLEGLKTDRLALERLQAAVQTQGAQLSHDAFLAVWGEGESAVKDTLLALRDRNPDLFNLVVSNTVKRLGGVFKAGEHQLNTANVIGSLLTPRTGVSGGLGRGRAGRFTEEVNFDDLFGLNPNATISQSGTAMYSGGDEDIITFRNVSARLPDILRNVFAVQEVRAQNGVVQPGMDNAVIEQKIREVVDNSFLLVGGLARERARPIQTATDPNTGAITGASIALPYAVAEGLGYSTVGQPSVELTTMAGAQVESDQHIMVPFDKYVDRMMFQQRGLYTAEKAMGFNPGSADPAGDHMRMMVTFVKELANSAGNLGQSSPELQAALAKLNVPPPRRQVTRLTQAPPSSPERVYRPEVLHQASFWVAPPEGVDQAALEAMQNSKDYWRDIGAMATFSSETATTVGEAGREGVLGGIVEVGGKPHIIVGLDGPHYMVRALTDPVVGSGFPTEVADVVGEVPAALVGQGRSHETFPVLVDEAGVPTDWVDARRMARTVLPKGFSDLGNDIQFLSERVADVLLGGEFAPPSATALDRQMDAAEIARLAGAMTRADSNTDNLTHAGGNLVVEMVRGFSMLPGGADQDDMVNNVLDFMTSPGIRPQDRIGMALYLSPQRAVEYAGWRRGVEASRISGAEPEPQPEWMGALIDNRWEPIRDVLGLEHLLGGQSRATDRLLEDHKIGAHLVPSPLRLLGDMAPAYLGRAPEAVAEGRAFQLEARGSGDTISQVGVSARERSSQDVRTVNAQFPEYGEIEPPDSFDVWMTDTERSLFAGRYAGPSSGARSVAELLRTVKPIPAPPPGVMEALFDITQNEVPGDDLINNRWGKALIAPSAARELGYSTGGAAVSAPFKDDDVLNADIGVRQMSHLTAKYGADDLEALIYSYLWGPGPLDHGRDAEPETWQRQVPRPMRQVGEMWIQRLLGTPPPAAGEAP